MHCIYSGQDSTSTLRSKQGTLKFLKLRALVGEYNIQTTSEWVPLEARSLNVTTAQPSAFELPYQPLPSASADEDRPRRPAREDLTIERTEVKTRGTPDSFFEGAVQARQATEAARPPRLPVSKRALNTFAGLFPRAYVELAEDGSGAGKLP